MTRTRTVTLGLSLAAGMAAMPMAFAWACTSLATIDIKPGAASTGAEVTGKGYGFAGSTSFSGVGSTPSPVEVHFQKADGPLLAKVQADPNGNVSFRFTAPAGAPNYYTIIATQTKSDGTPVSGTPARTTLALNHPRPLAADGASAATTTDVQAFGAAPNAVTHLQAPGAAAPQAAAPVQGTLQAAQAPAEALPPIAPAGARSKDILGAPARSSAGVGGQLGLTLAALGALGMLGAAGTVLVLRRSQTTQHI